MLVVLSLVVLSLVVLSVVVPSLVVPSVVRVTRSLPYHAISVQKECVV